MKHIKMKNFWLGIFFLLAIATAMKLFAIDSRPPVISHDEIYYTIQAKTLGLTGKDPSGLWNPLQFTAAHPLYAEWPGLIMMPASLIFGNYPFVAAKITHAIFGTLLSGILSAIIWQLTKNKTYVLSTLFVSLFNPWLFQTSRMGFDSLLSLFFYFFGMYLLLKLKGWNVLWSLLPFSVGFFMYQGLKVIFLPFVLILSFFLISKNNLTFSLKNNKHSVLPLLSVLFFSFIIMTVFFVRLQQQQASKRVNDLISPNSEYIITRVNTQRQQSINNPWSEIFINKYTVTINELKSKYLTSFDPLLLFVKGESIKNPFAVWSVGFFYGLDFLLIMMGIVTIFRYRNLQKTGLLLVCLALIGPLPSAINAHDSWIMFRSSFLFIVLLLFSGIGFGSLWQWGQTQNQETSETTLAVPYLLHVLQDLSLFKSRKRSFKVTVRNDLSGLAVKGIKIAFFLLYLMSIVSFLYEYIFRYPVYATEGKYFGERIFSNYSQRVNQDQQITILGDESWFLFNEYLFFSNQITRESITDIQNAYQTQQYSLANVTIKTDCVDLSQLRPNHTIIAQASIPACDGQSFDEIPDRYSVSHIPSLLDSGGVFKIFNDKLCNQYDLNRFSHVTEDVFSVEKLSTEQFCKHFIIRSE